MSESERDDDPASFQERLDGIEEALDAASTEPELDGVEADLDAIAADLDEADLPTPPEPEDDEEEPPPDPSDEIEERIADLRADLENQRGPYADEVIDAIHGAESTIQSTEWAEEGERELVEVVEGILAAIEGVGALGPDPTLEADIERMANALADAAEGVEEMKFDPDDDAAAIASLLEATDELAGGIDEATAFGDLPVREQLNRRGFFDVLGHYTDFPPEWSALKVHEDERNVEMILLAYDLLDSNFMEEHCLDALRRLGDERAIEPMMELAQRRDRDAIEVLGKIGSEQPVEMFFEYIETDSDPLLQRTTLKALGEIGSEEATEAVAQQLRAERSDVRSTAARALGMIGDPRAIAPLEDVLANDEATPVRGSAAWAMVEIGTADALAIVQQYTDDGDYLIEAEAAKVTEAA